MKKFSVRLLVTVLLILGVCADTHASGERRILEIKLEKQTYVEFEPIWLDVTLTHITADTLKHYRLAAPNHLGFWIDVKDSTGKAAEYTGPQILFGISSEPGVPYEAGEIDYGAWDLTELYGSFSSATGRSMHTWMFHYLPKGTYTIQAHFGDVSSNEIAMNIVAPTGDERKVLGLIERAGLILKRDNSLPAAQVYQEVVDRFPNSVFAEKCYNRARYYSLNTLEEKQEAMIDRRDFHRDLLLHYPNSGRCEGWLRSITRDLTDAEATDTLNKYAERFPDTRCARFAKQIRQQLEKERKLEQRREAAESVDSSGE